VSKRNALRSLKRESRTDILAYSVAMSVEDVRLSTKTRRAVKRKLARRVVASELARP